MDSMMTTIDYTNVVQSTQDVIDNIKNVIDNGDRFIATCVKQLNSTINGNSALILTWLIKPRLLEEEGISHYMTTMGFTMAFTRSTINDNYTFSPIGIALSTAGSSAVYSPNDGGEVTTSDNTIKICQVDDTLTINVGGGAVLTIASMYKLDNPKTKTFMLISNNLWYYPDEAVQERSGATQVWDARNIGYCERYYMQRFIFRGYVADHIYYVDGGPELIGHGTYMLGKDKIMKINDTNLFIKY